MHIISLELCPKKPSLPEAISFVRDETKETQVAASIQTVIESKIAHFSQASDDQLHKVNVQLPYKLARYLQACPQLISFAVESFYTRDPISLKSLKNLKFPFETTQLVTVKMTKTLYAQLISQKWNVPEYYLSFKDNKKFDNKEEIREKSIDLGLKIASSFLHFFFIMQLTKKI